jgi:hypothetical protein
MQYMLYAIECTLTPFSLYLSNLLAYNIYLKELFIHFVNIGAIGIAVTQPAGRGGKSYEFKRGYY